MAAQLSGLLLTFFERPIFSNAAFFHEKRFRFEDRQRYRGLSLICCIVSIGQQPERIEHDQKRRSLVKSDRDPDA